MNPPKKNQKRPELEQGQQQQRKNLLEAECLVSISPIPKKRGKIVGSN